MYLLVIAVIQNHGKFELFVLSIVYVLVMSVIEFFAVIIAGLLSVFFVIEHIKMNRSSAETLIDNKNVRIAINSATIIELFLVIYILCSMLIF